MTPGEVEFLTPEWAAALEEEANASEALRRAARGVHLTIQQEVTDAETEGLHYALRFEDGVVRVLWGRAEAPDVTFVQTRATAEALSRGTLNAQQAFMLGKLRVRGNLPKLMAVRDAFAELEDVLAALRARTRY